MATLTAKEFAAEIGTDAKTARKFLRTVNRDAGEATPGKGSRWAIERRDLRSLKKAFAAWTDAKVAKAASEAPMTPEELEEDNELRTAQTDARIAEALEELEG